jgi:hypothetical protein
MMTFVLATCVPNHTAEVKQALREPYFELLHLNTFHEHMEHISWIKGVYGPSLGPSVTNRLNHAIVRVAKNGGFSFQFCRQVLRM